jgi:predicted aldo/keto reductase-like oxidoreductase
MKTQCPQYGGHWKNLPSSKLHYYQGEMMHTAVLKWVLRHPFITTAIPGFTTFQQIADDFPVAYNLDYTDEEKKFLNDRDVSLSFGYCRQCSECTRQCTRGVDIPTLMRVHMYSVRYNNFHHARQTLDDIPADKSLGNCASCKQCPVQCKQGINIAIESKSCELSIAKGY